MFTDCDGQELSEGDRIAVQSLFYKELTPMRVVGFTKKMVKVGMVFPGQAERYVEPHRVALLRYQEES